MSLESVRAFLAQNAPDIAIIGDGRAPPPSLRLPRPTAWSRQGSPRLVASRRERSFLVVTSGTARLDNRKVKAAFGGKVSMLDAEQVQSLTGHPSAASARLGSQRRFRSIATSR
jgi:hypothetical protein